MEVVPVAEKVSQEGRAGLRVYENEEAADEQGASTRTLEGIEVFTYVKVLSENVTN